MSVWVLEHQRMRSSMSHDLEWIHHRSISLQTSNLHWRDFRCAAMVLNTPCLVLIQQKCDLVDQELITFFSSAKWYAMHQIADKYYGK